MTDYFFVHAESRKASGTIRFPGTSRRSSFRNAVPVNVSSGMAWDIKIKMSRSLVTNLRKLDNKKTTVTLSMSGFTEAGVKATINDNATLEVKRSKLNNK